MPEKRFKYIHPECGGVAFYLSRCPNTGDLPNPDEVILVNGERPKTGDQIICGSCGVGLLPDTRNIKPFRRWQDV